MTTTFALKPFRERYRNRRALVLGGFGAVGSYVAAVMAELGSRVTLLDTDTAPDRGSLINLVPGLREQFTIVQDSLTDAAAIRALIAEGHFHIVLNFAAHASFIEAAALDPLETFRTNALGVAVLMEALREHGRDLDWVFHASTDKVYGDSDGMPYDEETTPLRGSGLYDVSKVAGDLFFNAYRRAFGLPTITLRLCNLYGAHEFGLTADYRIIPKTLKALFEPPSPTPPDLYFDSLAHRRDYLYIDDFVRAILMLGERPGCIGETFNLPGYHASTPEILGLTVYAALEVADQRDPARAERIRANGLHIPLGDRPPHLITIAEQTATGEKLARATGFRPRVALREGLRRTAELYWTHYSRSSKGQSAPLCSLGRNGTQLPVAVK